MTLSQLNTDYEKAITKVFKVTYLLMTITDAKTKEMIEKRLQEHQTHARQIDDQRNRVLILGVSHLLSIPNLETTGVETVGDKKKKVA